MINGVISKSNTKIMKNNIQGGERVKTEPITKILDKLETLYVDAQNKIFLLNGKPIGEGIDYIQINFDGIKWIVTMKCEVTVMKEVSTYNRAGEKIS